MTFRVVERAGDEHEEQVRTFNNPYAAVDFITTAWFEGDRKACWLHLVDGAGEVLLGPEDIIGDSAADRRR